MSGSKIRELINNVDFVSIILYMYTYIYIFSIKNRTTKNFCLFFCFLSYFNIDPLKSRFFLIISLLLLSPYISNSVRQLFCYFICLLFLSGIFVIIVYFSSLSNIILKKTRFLERLDMNLIRFDDNSMLGFGRSLRMSSTLYELHVESCQLNGKILQKFIQNLRGCPCLRELYLCDNRMYLINIHFNEIFIDYFTMIKLI